MSVPTAGPRTGPIVDEDGTHVYVAFFRNLNLGQRRSHSPTRPELLEAFEHAGAAGSASFQVNGTVIYETETDPLDLAEQVVARLTSVCGYADLVIARPATWVRRLELAGAPDHAEISLFEGPDPFPEPLPWVAPGARLTVIRADGRHALCVNAAANTGGGTAALEKRLGLPVTSRGVPTMRRLQARLG